MVRQGPRSDLGSDKKLSEEDWISVGLVFSEDPEQAWMIIGGGAPSTPLIGTAYISKAHEVIICVLCKGIRPSPPCVIWKACPNLEVRPMDFFL